MKRLVVVALLSSMLVGCVSVKEHQKVIKENKYLAEQVTHLRDSDKRLRTQLEA